jgi:lactate permease
LLTPVGSSLLLSFIVAALPIFTVLVMLGALRRPAWQASLAGFVVALILAVQVWHFPAVLALAAAANGATFALWPLMWIVFNAILLYNVAVTSGSFDAFRDWILEHLPNDRRVVLVVIGFCFGALLEGIAGWHTRCHHQRTFNSGRFYAARRACFYQKRRKAPAFRPGI